MDGFATVFLAFILLFPTAVLGDCTCESDEEERNKTLALKYKLAAIASILVAIAIGVCLPVLGFVAMVSGIGTLMVDTYATSYYRRKSSGKTQIASGDEGGVVPVHTHATHGHAHGSVSTIRVPWQKPLQQSL
ncbi:Zinc transporter 5-like [Abeliophyllum distichum]|uniref:Zinc transporter 5-like n=1 Tax=Abeliophyllum distichum TaxID=126358 RepID=A0ABD1PLY2_9LAMI